MELEERPHHIGKAKASDVVQTFLEEIGMVDELKRLLKLEKAQTSDVPIYDKMMAYCDKNGAKWEADSLDTRESDKHSPRPDIGLAISSYEENSYRPE